MIIYESTQTDFTYNGKGYLKDVISAYVVDTLNGDYSLTFEYPTNAKLSEYIVEGNYIKCKVADGSQQIFMITNVVKTFDTLKVQAKHVFYKLLYNFLEDVYPQNLNCQDFLNWILSHTQYNNEFTGYSNISSTFKSARYVRKNPVEAIIGDEDNSMVNLYGGELKRDNFKIYFNNRIGNDEGVKLIFGKNITGININIDNSNCYTRIMPIGYDELLLPEKYIDSDLINSYPFPRIAIYKFEDVKYDPNDEEAYHDINDAYDALREKVQELYDAGIDKPQVNMTIDWLELSKTSQYQQYAALERVHLGDTIYANILGVEFETRIIKTTYNPLNDTIEKFEIGTIKPSIATSMNNIVKLVEKVNPDSILTQAQQNATSLITQAMGGYVYKTNSELYIMDTNDPATAEKVWRWNINGLGYSSTGINGPYGIAMTMDGSIVADYITTGTLNTNVIQGYDSLVISVSDATQQVAALSLTVAELNSKIQDVIDITTSAESEYGYVELFHINSSEPIMVQIHPITNDIKNLYPSETLYPNASLYPHSAILKFTNVDTSEVFEYSLPCDLLYLDADTYDTFYLSYDENVCQVEHKVGINQQGQKYELATPVIETFTFPHIYLTTGDEYQVELVGLSSAYLFVRLMSSNIYTTQFATRSEVSQTASAITTYVEREYASKDLMNSTITQTADSINLEVSKKVGNDEVISKINQSAEQITIQANKVNLTGYATFTDLSTGGRTTINGSNITTGTIDASRATITNINASNITGGTINGTNVNIQNLNSSNITNGTLSSGSINIGGKFIVNSSGRMVAYGADNQHYISMNAGSGHPMFSGINVNYDSGISFRESAGVGNVGSAYASIGREYLGSGSYLFSIDSTSGGDDLQIVGKSLYLKCNKKAAFIVMYPGSDSAAFINGRAWSNRILTNGGDPSSKNVKKNFKNIEDEYKDIYEDLKNLNMYNYDYKYKNINGDLDKDYGFVIDEIENTKHLSKYFRNYKTTKYITKDNKLVVKPDTTLNDEEKEIFKGAKEIDVKEWSKEGYIKGLFILVKSLQNEIEDLKEEIKNLKGGNE